MIGTTNKIGYKAFGLNLLSEIQLPELILMNSIENVADVEIKKGDLSNYWQEVSPNHKQIIIKENFVIFQIPNVATYMIQDGKRIIVSPMNGSDPDRIRIYLLSTCMATLLLQRNILPLHASTIAVDGKAYAIVGSSGSGKSTVAKAFMNKGYHILGDDIIGVSLSIDNQPIVTPSFPQQRLWQESLHEFGLEAAQFRPIYEKKTKFLVPIQQFFVEPLPLAGLFELTKEENDEVEIAAIQNLERIRTLFYHTFRRSFIHSLGLMDWHFHTIATIAKKMDFYRLKRPTSQFTAYQITSLIESTIKREDTHAYKK